MSLSADLTHLPLVHNTTLGVAQVTFVTIVTYIVTLGTIVTLATMW